MNEYLIPVLIFVAVMALGGAIIAAIAAWRAPVQARLDELELGTSNNPDRTVEASGAVRFAGQVGGAVSSGKASATLKAELAQAGYHGESAVLVFLGAKVVLLVTGLLLLLFLVLPLLPSTMALQTRLFIIFGGAAILFFLPNLFLRLQRSRRRMEVRHHLADVIDLLEISVSAGMGLDTSWNSVAEEIRAVSSTLADEMALTNLETYLGSPRADAMRHMAERTGAEEIASLVSVLVQSDQFGTSISDALKTFATTMREERSQRAEESAEKMPVKLLFPLAFFIFPAVIIVMCGPAIIKWKDIMAGS